MILIHASCVAIDGKGVLIRGGAGAGKSDLALRLIDEGAILVADDYCEAAAKGGTVEVTAPARLAGLIEARGIGVLHVPHLARCPLALVVDVMPWSEIPRVPDQTTAPVEGIEIRWIRVDASAVSAAARIRAALRYDRLGIDQMLPEARRA